MKQKIDYISMIYPYYNNSEMLNVQIEEWNKWREDILDRVTIFVIDDGSKTPLEKSLFDCCKAKVRLFRILVNKPWNVPGAQNLGMYNANDGWCFTSDIDHVIPYHQMEILFDETLVEPSKYYFFPRKRAYKEADDYINQHSNSWLMTKKLFWESGGYDEDFAGFYGHDKTFRIGMGKLAGKKQDLDRPYLTVFSTREVKDAETNEWGRKNSEYDATKNSLLAKKIENYEKPTNPLRFPWKEIF